MTLTREFYTPKEAVQIAAADSSAVAYIETKSGRVHAKGFSGKRAKPDFYYTFRTEAEAREYIARHAATVKNREAARVARQAQITAAKCLTPLAVWLKAQKEGSISAPDAAVCLRAALARAFPGVKFSVRSDSGLRVSWTDGPQSKAVEAIACKYSFQGFDGMVDCRYQKRRWLSQDGSMSNAHNPNHAGCYPGVTAENKDDGATIGDPHAPDAVLVEYGPDFVFVNRTIGDGEKERLTRAVCADYGITVPPLDAPHALDRFLNSFVTDAGDYLCQLVHRAAGEEGRSL